MRKQFFNQKRIWRNLILIIIFLVMTMVYSLSAKAQKDLTGFFGGIAIHNFENNVQGLGLEFGVINLQKAVGFGLDASRLSAKDFDVTFAHMNFLFKVKKDFLIPISIGTESKTFDDIIPSFGFGGIYLFKESPFYFSMRGYLSIISVPHDEVSFSNVSAHFGFKF